VHEADVTVRVYATRSNQLIVCIVNYRRAGYVVRRVQCSRTLVWFAVVRVAQAFRCHANSRLLDAKFTAHHRISRRLWLWPYNAGSNHNINIEQIYLFIVRARAARCHGNRSVYADVIVR